MRCEVLLFAQLAEAAGTPRVTLELDEGATVEDVLAELSKRWEILETLGDRIAVAVDERYCQRTTPLRDGQTVALIPPVSGG